MFNSTNIEGRLITSGIGHIKFWEMANTFTGLKLQGELGKFGQIDLSDISAFVEFPDGKVLSGTEYGTFLLWEGIFIKGNIMMSETQKCHNGLIEYMTWDGNKDNAYENIITAGHDGFIKIWSFYDLENLNIDDNNIAYLKPVKEKMLLNPITEKPVKIINIVKQTNFWIVQDGNGYMLKVHLEEGDIDKIKTENILEFHSGPIVKLFILSPSPILLVQGADSKSSMINLSNNSNSFAEKLIIENQSGDLITTACDIAPRESDDDSLVYAIGYSIGLFRIYQFDQLKMQLELSFQSRAHEEPIKKILFSPDKTYLLTATNKEIFLFLIVELDKINPLCCIKRRDNENIVDIDWHIDSKRILLGLSTGTVEEIEIPLTFDNSKSYILTDYAHKIFIVKLAEGQIEKDDQKKKRRLNKESKIKPEPGPSQIYSCKYINMYKEGDFLLTAAKPYNDSLYLCSFDDPKARPVNFWKLPSSKEFYVKSISKNFVFLANSKGAVQIRHFKMMDKYLEVFPNLFSAVVQDITTSSNERTLAISYKDGTTLIYTLDLEGFEQYLKLALMSETIHKKKLI